MGFGVTVSLRLAAALGGTAWLLVSGCGPGTAGSYEALIDEGQASLSRGEPDAALERFRLAQRVRPDRKEPYVYIGGICESRETPRVGIPILRDAVARNDENRATYHFLLAVLLELADDRTEAEHHYRECLRLQPDFAPAWANLGQFLFTAGRDAEALDLLASAEERFPEEHRIRLQYSEILMRVGRLDDAERLARRVLEQEEPPVGSHYLMGLIALERRRADDARTHLARATERDPGNYRAWYQLANACDRLGDLATRDEALRRFEPLLRAAASPGID
jgi:tetratricopeptide (TPR) repeat protein